MKDQVPEQIKTARSHVLMDIAKQMQQAYIDWYVDKDVEVLTEDAITYEGEEYRIGHTKTYVKCMVKADDSNEMVCAHAVKHLDNNTLLTL